MRMVVVAGVSLTLLAGSGWADEIYRWTDAGGAVHYSNTPTTAGTPAGVGGYYDTPPPSRDAEADAGAEAKPAADDAGFSTSASLRRNALERDARTTDRKLHDLDARLTSLARARTANVAGNAATGGLGTLAGDVRSDEERALAEQRAQVAQHADDVRGEYAKLRDEVTSKLGTTPAWWNELRTSAR
jgi:hypothetical protein